MRLSDCPRNQKIRRTAFVERASELLPHSAEDIEAAALARYGPSSPDAPSSSTLSDQIESKIRFYTWFADGKPA